MIPKTLKACLIAKCRHEVRKNVYSKGIKEEEKALGTTEGAAPLVGDMTDIEILYGA